MPTRNFSRMFFRIDDNDGDGQTPDNAAARLPQEYNDVLNVPDLVGELLPAKVYMQPSTSPSNPIEDEINIRDDQTKFEVKWARKNKDSIDMNLLPLPPDNEHISPVTLSISRDGSGTRVASEHTQTDDLSTRPLVGGVEPDISPADPGITMQVRTVTNYDRKGLMTNNSIQQTMNGGEEGLSANLSQYDAYDGGLLHSRAFNSDIRWFYPNNPGNMTSIIVDSKKSYDAKGLIWGHDIIDLEAPDLNGKQVTEHSTADITRLPDGTYSFKTVGMGKEKDGGKIISSEDTSYIAADGQGMKILSGTSTTIDHDTKTVKTINEKGVWVLDQSQTPPADQNKDNAAIQKRRSSVAATPV